MYDLIGSQRDLLYVAASLDEPHGFATKDQLEDCYETEIHHGRLHPNLDILVRKRLLDKDGKDHRTNVYTTIVRSRREIKACDDWEQQYISELAA